MKAASCRLVSVNARKCAADRAERERGDERDVVAEQRLVRQHGQRRADRYQTQQVFRERKRARCREEHRCVPPRGRSVERPACDHHRIHALRSGSPGSCGTPWPRCSASGQVYATAESPDTPAAIRQRKPERSRGPAADISRMTRSFHDRPASRRLPLRSAAPASICAGPLSGTASGTARGSRPPHRTSSSAVRPDHSSAQLAPSADDSTASARGYWDVVRAEKEHQRRDRLDALRRDRWSPSPSRAARARASACRDCRR